MTAVLHDREPSSATFEGTLMRDVVTGAVANFCGARSSAGRRKLAYLSEDAAATAALVQGMRHGRRHEAYRCTIFILDWPDAPEHWHLTTQGRRTGSRTGTGTRGDGTHDHRR